MWRHEVINKKCHRIIIRSLVVLSAASYCLPLISYAYDDIVTHPKIVEEAIKASGLDEYLKNKLSCSEGIKKNLKQQGYDQTQAEVNNGLQISSWLSKGSTIEDAPLCRASNHFHDPLKSWSESYVTDYPAISMVCFSSPWSQRYSNITWATGLLDRDGQPISFPDDYLETPPAPNNWTKARNYYYKALTNSASGVRETNFAKTFQAVGQVMHLLEDMAVPAHVRNDFTSHMTFSGATSPDPTKWFNNPFEFYVKKNPYLVSSITPIIPSMYQRHTDYWDANKYIGQDPSLLSNLGLAEYTNINFLSDSSFKISNGTIVSDFPYPQQSSVTRNDDYPIDDPLHPGTMVSRPYFIKTAHGEAGYLLSGVDYMTFVGETITGLQVQPEKTLPPLDDNVHNAYAQMLLPRAVGYSAGLLDYFFRGDISLWPTDTTGEYRIYNFTQEEITGDLAVYYEDDGSDIRRPLPDDAGASGNLVFDIDLSAMTQSVPVRLLPEQTPSPQDKDTYILAFKGTMGNESGAVAGRVKKWWREEWDKGLADNHEWRVIDGANPVVTGGRLTIENVHPNNQRGLYLNLTRLPGTAYGLPRLVTDNTVLWVKVDELSVNSLIPDSACDIAESPYGCSFQGIVIRFSSGPPLVVSLQEQCGDIQNEYGYIYCAGKDESGFGWFVLNELVGVYLYSGLAEWDEKYQQPLYVTSIDLLQQLGPLKESVTPEYRQQKMTVDFIRIED